MTAAPPQAADADATDETDPVPPRDIAAAFNGLQLKPRELFAVEQIVLGVSRRDAGKKAGISRDAMRKRVRRLRKRLLDRMTRAQRERYLAALNAGGRRHLIRPFSLSPTDNV